MPFTYILKCSDESFFVGSTWDLAERFEEHQTGKGANHTAKRASIELANAEQFDRIEDAYRRERRIHRWSRAMKSALALEQADRIPSLAKKTFHRGLARPPFDTPPLAALREPPLEFPLGVQFPMHSRLPTMNQQDSAVP